MRQALLNVSAALSLLLCVAACALWARSMRTRDVVLLDNARPGRDRAQWHLCAAGGEARVMRVRGPIAYGRPPGRTWWSEPSDGQPWSWPGTDSSWGLLGASVRAGGMGRDAVVGPTTYYRVSYRALVVPLWMPALLLAVMPGVRGVRWWRGPVGGYACRVCGYDLRATPDRCPECGAVPDGRITRQCNGPRRRRAAP